VNNLSPDIKSTPPDANQAYSKYKHVLANKLTFCVHVMLPERHHWKPAVQAAAVMLRTPPPSMASHRPASHVNFPYTARNFENIPITRRSLASSAHTPRRAFALCRHIAGWMQACNYSSCYVAIAMQPAHRLQIRPIVHN